jgi:hypothetical protein
MRGMHKQLKLLPEWKIMILNCIESCQTIEQVYVCDTMIDHFTATYKNWLGPLELYKHQLDLRDAYDRKIQPLLTKTAEQ